MNRTKYILTIIVLALCILTSFALRTALPAKNVFENESVKLSGVDSFYHMRLIENSLNHYPQRIYFDPYSAWPDG
ncbi:MAG: hypothetical protein GX811_00840, partial [Lentisphaerae bacterium]|nr:hypothetical protein [Lentisphaerota bacterium]